MARFNIIIKNIEQFENLRKQIKDYKIIRTNYSVQLKSKDYNIFCTNKKIYRAGLNLIVKIRNSMKKNINRIDWFEPEKFKYKLYDVNDNIHVRDNEKITEIDISKAYITAALNLGVLEKKYYEKLLKVQKGLRLKVLGMLAVKKNIEIYENNKLIEQKTKYDEEGKRIWDCIIWSVDSLMQFIKTNQYNSFIFYWFDNMFLFNSYNIDKTEELIKSKYFNIKRKELDIIMRKKGIIYFFKLSDGREFIIPSRKNFNFIPF